MNAIAGDSTDILGGNPGFPNGFTSDALDSRNKPIVDSTPTNPAVLGAAVDYNPVTGTWAQNTTAGNSAPGGKTGIVISAALVQGGQAVIQTSGIVQALVATPTVPTFVGCPLMESGAGALIPAVIPAALPTAPSAGGVTVNGTAGSTTVTYSIYSRNVYGIDSAAESGVSTTTGNATLSATNSCSVSATVPTGTAAVTVVRTAGGAAQGVLGTFPVAINATSFLVTDVGFVAGASSYVVQTSPKAPPGLVKGYANAVIPVSTAAALSSVTLA